MTDFFVVLRICDEWINFKYLSFVLKIYRLDFLGFDLDKNFYLFPVTSSSNTCPGAKS